MIDRNTLFKLLRRIKDEYEGSVASVLRPAGHDHFINYCENKYGFRPKMNYVGFTGEYIVVDESKFNWLLLKMLK